MCGTEPETLGRRGREGVWAARRTLPPGSGECESQGPVEGLQVAMTGGPWNGCWVAESPSGPNLDWHPGP